MKNLFIALTLISHFAFAGDDLFKKEAAQLAKDLRESLVKELSRKMTEGGPMEAIPFCHDNVKTIAKGAAGDRTQKYEFGRTSHKIRNQQNVPKEWLVSYLERFKGTRAAPDKEKGIVHVFPDGKRAYLEPLYVMPLCLNCHGPSVSPNVQAKIKELYPQDSATGFTLGEFRGFLWIKEK